MAVARTGAMFKSFEFDGEDSRDFGIYITGEAVFNAPERDVEMIEIPGRNGAYSLDKGRFSNIEVTYPAGMFAPSDTDFADAISAARNWLCSKKGYVRLSDEYNPDEYRLAVYKSGLEVTSATLAAGEFDITFECMPQRWLSSGETAVAVASGGTVTNPTRFPSRPLLEVYGYGGMTVNGTPLSINSGPLGIVEVMGQRSGGRTFNMQDNASFSIPIAGTLNTASLNAGDDILVNYDATIRIQSAVAGMDLTSALITKTGGDLGGTPAASVVAGAGNIVVSGTTSGGAGTAETFTKGTARTASGAYDFQLMYTNTTGGLTMKTGTLSLSLAYDGAEGITMTGTITATAGALEGWATIILTSAQGDSTKSAIGEPAYIDLDIGEAYKIESGQIVGINNGVTLPGELPELEPGENVISYDATVTALSIVPRWWKV